MERTLPASLPGGFFFWLRGAEDYVRATAAAIRVQFYLLGVALNYALLRVLIIL